MNAEEKLFWPDWDATHPGQDRNEATPEDVTAWRAAQAKPPNDPLNACAPEGQSGAAQEGTVTSKTSISRAPVQSNGGTDKDSVQTETALNPLDCALGYARDGHPVFPLAPGSKVPFAGSNGLGNATTDEATIRQWWGANPSAGVAIRCDNWLVLDTDPRNGGTGTLAALEAQHGPLPQTRKQLTARRDGGSHGVFQRPDGKFRKKRSDCPGLDFLTGPSFYIVAEPTVIARSGDHPGGSYVWDRSCVGLEPAEAPAWLLDLFRKPAEVTPEPTAPVSDIHAPAAIVERARAYASSIPGAREGSRDSTTFQVACECVRFGLSREQAEPIVAEYAARCLPPFTDNIKHKIQRAYTDVAHQFGERLKGENEITAVVNGALAKVSSPGRPIMQSRTDANHVLLWEGPHCGYQPVAVGSVLLRIRELGLDHVRTTYTDDKGKTTKLSPAKVVESNGATFRNTAYDFSTSVSVFEPEFDRVRVGFTYPDPARKVEPKFDDDTDAWVRAIAGPQYTQLESWIVSCHQRHINRLSAVLTLIGPNNVGKTLFANAVAWLWGCDAAPSFGLLLDRFNGDLTRCPVLLDDEGQVIGSRKFSTKKFREEIQKTEHSIERKNKERFQLYGAWRPIIAGNALADIQFTDVSDPEVVEAVNQRMLVIDTKPRAKACREALEKLRVDGQFICDIRRIANHLAWLQETIRLPVERFVGGGSGAGAVLAGHAASTPEIWESFRGWVDSGCPVACQQIWSVHTSARGVVLCVDREGLLGWLSASDKRWTLGQVEGALNPFKVGTIRPRNETRKRLWALNSEGVAGLLKLDAEELETLVAQAA